MPVVHAGGRPLLDISATLKELVAYVLPSDTLFRVISFKEKTKQNSCRLLAVRQFFDIEADSESDTGFRINSQ
jgi:hypothetical protein